MNDPWDVKSVRQSDQYMSCMKLNGVPLLPPILSRECRKEMQYYKLLAGEVEKRIHALKPYIVESDTDSNTDKTDAPELPESELSYELPSDELKTSVDVDFDKNVNLEKSIDEPIESAKLNTNNTYENITSNFTTDTDSTSSKLSSKLVIDLSLSINDTGKNLLDSANSSHTQVNDVPERDCNCPTKRQKELLTDIESHQNNYDNLEEKLCFSLSVNSKVLSDPITNSHFSKDEPSSLGSKSFTGSLNNLHIESVKETEVTPLIRQRSYTVLKPSPMLLAHLEVQSLNTGVDIKSISMSESLSNISCSNKKRRSWDLESAKVKWSSMAMELKQKVTTKNYKNEGNSKSPKRSATSTKSVQNTPVKSLTLERVKQNPIKSTTKSDPIQKSKKTLSPVRDPLLKNNPKNTTLPQPNAHKEEVKQKPISECEDPATRVRELYEKIQKQQLVQMANLVDKQKREQMLLQQVFEEQNNLLFTQLKTICPKSPNEVKEAWVEKTDPDRGPVSLSQLIDNKCPDQNIVDSPVLATLTETNNYINHCDKVLKKSRDISSSIKKHPTKSRIQEDKHSVKSITDGSRTRTHSPSRNTPASRKLTYETSASSDHDYDPILTDRTNDTFADLNVTFTSDSTEECQRTMHNNLTTKNNLQVSHSPLTAPAVGSTCISTDRAIRSMEETIQNSINSMCVMRGSKQKFSRQPTARERAAATTIVAHAKGFLVRRLMRTERVQATVQTINDALLCALQLHQDRAGIRGADVDLHRRLIQQITAACYSLHDTFVASSPAERCAAIAADRSRRRALAARAPRQHRPTDL